MLPISQVLYGYLAAAGASNAAFSMMENNQARMALANRVTPAVANNPQQFAALHQTDKMLALQNAQNAMNYDYYSAWQEQLSKMRQKEQARQQAAISAGATYA